MHTPAHRRVQRRDRVHHRRARRRGLAGERRRRDRSLRWRAVHAAAARRATLRRAVVSALHEDRGGRLWVGTDLGLHRFENGALDALRDARGAAEPDRAVDPRGQRRPALGRHRRRRARAVREGAVHDLLAARRAAERPPPRAARGRARERCGSPPTAASRPWPTGGSGATPRATGCPPTSCARSTRMRTARCGSGPTAAGSTA